MQFHDIRFPVALSFGALGGPERRTEVVELASGHEERNSPWADSRRRYDAGTGLRALDDLERVVAFFRSPPWPPACLPLEGLGRLPIRPRQPARHPL